MNRSHPFKLLLSMEEVPKPLKKKRICDRLFQTTRARSRPSHAMSREARKRTASARDADDAPADGRRGRASAGPSGSARDAKAVKREKSQKGKAPVVEAVIELDEEEDDDEFNEQNDAGIAQMVRPPCIFSPTPSHDLPNASATRARSCRTRRRFRARSTSSLEGANNRHRRVSFARLPPRRERRAFNTQKTKPI